MANIYDYESNPQSGDMPYDQAEQADGPESHIHFQTGSSTVQCGYPMRGVFMGPADGWDLGDVTVNIAEVTCPHCLTKKCAGCNARIPVSDPAVCETCDRMRLADIHPTLRGYEDSSDNGLAIS